MRSLVFVMLAWCGASACVVVDEADCIPGASLACTCTNGAHGAQVCRPNGRSLGPCVCEPGVSDTSGATADVSGDLASADTHEDASDVQDAGDVAETDAPETDVGACEPTSFCPVAAIRVAPGIVVKPRTALLLDGSASFGAGCELTSYTWEVIQPAGSTSVFSPSPYVAMPTFEANVPGTYTFRLTVTDERGVASCVAAEVEVTVVDDDALRIELLWSSPNDSNETDDVGSDLDLHFAHPLALGGYDGDGDGLQDGWFDIPFDCFWLNSDPNWGSIDPSVPDNPAVLRDDTDGAGPEIISLAAPENATTYKVGVHYWNGHGFGPSYATVRVYIAGALVFEAKDVELQEADMWTVTSIAWPPGDAPPELATVCAGTTNACATDADCGGERCGPRIAHGYAPPSVVVPR